jgi:hypothetical protein
MPTPALQVRLQEPERAAVETFIAAWRSLQEKPTEASRADALRTLIRLGLDAAARPSLFDERWFDLLDRIARLEHLLDALGRAVSANPALAAFLIGQSQPARDQRSREHLAEKLEALFQADWDERCRSRGIPRPRFTRPVRRVPVESALPGAESAPKTFRIGVRVTPEDRRRVVAYAVRADVSAQVAHQRALQIGLAALEAESHQDDIDRLVDRLKRVEIQLDEIGALATTPAAVAVHLVRRWRGHSDEWEQMVLNEVEATALATWTSLQQGPPPSADPSLVDFDLDDDEDDARQRHAKATLSEGR